MLKDIWKLADIASRGGKVPPIYLYLIFILPGFAFSVVRTGKINYLPFVLISIAIIPLIIATNLFDDYFDYVKGYDKADSPNTKYRRHPIFYYNVSSGYLIKWAVIFSLIYVAFCLLISLRFGIILILFGLTGFALGYGYTGPPIGYKYVGLGEVGVMLSTVATGEFIAVATAGHFYVTSLLFLLPFATIISLLLFLGNYRDLESDKLSGFITLAVVLGKKRSELFSVVVFSLFYGLIVYLYLIRVYGTLALLEMVTAPFSYYFSLNWTRRDSSSFEKYAGPFLFGISLLLIFLIVL